MRGNHEFLQMAMIRTLKAIEQVLKGGALMSSVSIAEYRKLFP